MKSPELILPDVKRLLITAWANKVRFCFILLLLIIPLSSCSNRSTIETNRINLRLNENPLTFDPHLTVDVTGGEVLAKIHSGLLKFDEQYNIVPDLVKSFSLKEDGKTYEFLLADNARFSDGEKITSSHVRSSFKRLLSPHTLSPRRWVLDKILGADSYIKGESEDIEGIRIIDEQKFQIILKEKFSPFLSLLTMPQASIFKVEEYNGKYHFTGAGPYKLNDFKFDQYLSLSVNEFYESQKKRSNIRYHILPEDSSAIAMLALKDLDIIKLPRQQTSLLRRKLQGVSFSTIEELNTYYIGFDLRKPYLDQSLRSAVSLSVDKAALVDMVLGGQAKEAVTAVPPVLLTGIDLQKYTRKLNRDKAVADLKQSSYDGRELIFLISSGREAVAAASVIQDNLKSLNINLRLKVVEWSAYKSSIEAGEADLFLLSWWADYADPENFLAPVFLSENKGPAGNRVHYVSEKADHLIKGLVNSATAEEKRALTNKILLLLSEDLPWIPLWHRTSTYAVSDDVEGFLAPPMYTMSKAVSLRRKEC